MGEFIRINTNDHFNFQNTLGVSMISKKKTITAIKESDDETDID